MHVIVRSLFIACLMASFASASVAAPGSASVFKGDAQLSGISNAPPPRALLGVRFRFRADGPIRSTPAYANGMVYFGSDDGNFYALDARSGVIGWKFAAGVGVSSSASIVGGLAYFTAWDGQLFAVSAADGKQRWKAQLGRDLGNMDYWDFFPSSPTLFGNILYVGSGDGNVYAFDRITGRKLWAHDTGSRVRSTPAVTDAFVVAGTMDGHVVALDRRTGAERWKFATDGAGYNFARKNNDTTGVPSPPAIANGVVTIGGRDANLYALDLQTGALRWKTTHDGEAWMLNTAMEGATVYSGSGSAFVIQSAKLSNGAENWRVQIGGASYGVMTIAGDVLVGVDLAGDVHAFGTAKGNKLWSFPLGDRILGGALVADGAVFVGSDSGAFVALDTTTVAAPVSERKRLVYARPNPGPNDLQWFQNGIDRLLSRTFAANGYTELDDGALMTALNDQIAGRGRSVIVFADGYLPQAAADIRPPLDPNAPKDAKPADATPGLLRRFIDAGGVAIFLGINPLGDVYDARGLVTGFSEGNGLKSLGITPLARGVDSGHYSSRYTREGERWGLSDRMVTSTAVGADQVTTVLASNRMGHAAMWTKAYAGGGLVMYLPIPRNVPVDIAPLRAAVDYAVTH